MKYLVILFLTLFGCSSAVSKQAQFPPTVIVADSDMPPKYKMAIQTGITMWKNALSPKILPLTYSESSNALMFQNVTGIVPVIAGDCGDTALGLEVNSKLNDSHFICLSTRTDVDPGDYLIPVTCHELGHVFLGLEHVSGTIMGSNPSLMTSVITSTDTDRFCNLWNCTP